MGVTQHPHQHEARVSNNGEAGSSGQHAHPAPLDAAARNFTVPPMLATPRGRITTMQQPYDHAALQGVCSDAHDNATPLQTHTAGGCGRLGAPHRCCHKSSGSTGTTGKQSQAATTYLAGAGWGGAPPAARHHGGGCVVRLPPHSQHMEFVPHAHYSHASQEAWCACIAAGKAPTWFTFFGRPGERVGAPSNPINQHLQNLQQRRHTPQHVAGREHPWGASHPADSLVVQPPEQGNKPLPRENQPHSPGAQQPR